MQWSLVCRISAQAAPGALLGCEALNLIEMNPKIPTAECVSKSCSFDSQLLRQCATMVRCLHIGDWAMQCKGFTAFVAAATNLAEVVILTHKHDSALVDNVLCASTSVLTIRSKGSVHRFSFENGTNYYIPCQLPQQLQKLSVSFWKKSWCQKSAHGFPKLQTQFEAFLTMVCKMSHLQELSINCASLALTCSVRPPRLARLDLHLRMWPEKLSQLDLGWLHGSHPRFTAALRPARWRSQSFSEYALASCT